MTTAIILLNVEGKETSRIAESIASLAGITEVYSVAGNYDLVAVVRVATNEALADLVTDQIRARSRNFGFADVNCLPDVLAERSQCPIRSGLK